MGRGRIVQTLRDRMRVRKSIIFRVIENVDLTRICTLRWPLLGCMIMSSLQFINTLLCVMKLDHSSDALDTVCVAVISIISINVLCEISRDCPFRDITNART